MKLQMKDVKFSVAIPAYKSRFLKEAIESVLSQTYQNYELIIVNDASPYDIDSIICLFNDPRIHYFRNEKNCGAKNVVDNWNVCLSKSSGDYFMCIGDDDKIKPNCLNDFNEMIHQYPAVDIFHSRTEIIDENSVFKELLDCRPEWESVFSLISSINDSGLGSYLYKTSTLRKNGGFYNLPYGWSSDFISAFIAADKYGIVNTQKAGFQYRRNGMSISHDMFGIEDKIVANNTAKDWILSFISMKDAANASEKNMKVQIPKSIIKTTNVKNDDLIEFDIRKNFFNRALFWFSKRLEYDISFVRYLKCVIRSIKYRYKNG